MIGFFKQWKVSAFKMGKFLLLTSMVFLWLGVAMATTEHYFESSEEANPISESVERTTELAANLDLGFDVLPIIQLAEEKQVLSRQRRAPRRGLNL